MINIAAAFKFLVLSYIMFDKGLCHPTGAPSSQCVSMMPSHGVAAQTITSPYEVQVDKPYYMSGSNVKLSIRSSTDNIKGFLIQARQVGANSATGMFATLPTNGEYVACGNNRGAITHSTRLSVKTIDFVWTPPSNFAENISFFATVVKDRTTFWVKLQSVELYKKEMPTHHTSISVQPFQSTRSMTSKTSMTSVTSSTIITQPSVSVQTSSNQTTSNPSTTYMRYMTTVVPSTPTDNSTCKADNPKCGGAQLNQNAFLLFFVGLVLAFMENGI